MSRAGIKEAAVEKPVNIKRKQRFALRQCFFQYVEFRLNTKKKQLGGDKSLSRRYGDDIRATPVWPGCFDHRIMHFSAELMLFREI